MGYYVDAALSKLEDKPFGGLILRGGKQTGITIECPEKDVMAIRGLGAGFPPYVQFKGNDVYASFNGKEFERWDEGCKVGVQMYRLLDPRIYRWKIGSESLAQVSPTRSIARYKYKLSEVLPLLELPTDVSGWLIQAAGVERDLTFDLDRDNIQTVIQKDVPPLDDEVSLVVFQDP